MVGQRDVYAASHGARRCASTGLRALLAGQRANPPWSSRCPPVRPLDLVCHPTSGHAHRQNARHPLLSPVLPREVLPPPDPDDPLCHAPCGVIHGLLIVRHSPTSVPHTLLDTIILHFPDSPEFSGKISIH